MMLNNVDLPQPDGPITAKNSPGRTDSDTLSIAVSTPSGVSNCLTMLSTVRIGSAARAGSASRPDGMATTGIDGVTPEITRRPATADVCPTLAGTRLHRQTVARMVHSDIRGNGRTRREDLPAFASLNPGYELRRWALRRLRRHRAVGAAAPVFPRAIERIGAGALDDLVDLAGGK